MDSSCKALFSLTLVKLSALHKQLDKNHIYVDAFQQISPFMPYIHTDTHILVEVTQFLICNIFILYNSYIKYISTVLTQK